MNIKSYLNESINRSSDGSVHGRGIFASKPVKAGEVVAVKAGRAVSGDELSLIAGKVADSDLQIDDDLYLAPISEDEVEDSMIYINHSCNPNVGLSGNVIFVAMKDIATGEELTLDYAMFDNNDTSFKCSCGAIECRGVITGRDWQKPELQNKYKGYFSTYLEKKMQ